MNFMETRCCPISHLLPCNIDLLCCCFSGFFRSDTLIGTATVKLQPLETACEIHESFDVSELSIFLQNNSSNVYPLPHCS